MGGSDPDPNFVEVTVFGSMITIIVEALDPFQAGDFVVPVQFTPSFSSSVCGNGVRESDEQCDDANTLSGDGCSDACKAEAGVLCSNMPVIAQGATQATFESATKSFFGACTGSLDLPERGFRYTAVGNSVTVSVDATADVGLYATLGCGDSAIPLACANNTFGPGVEQIQLVTQPNDPITIFVELGETNPAATFTLNVTEP